MTIRIVAACFGFLSWLVVGIFSLVFPAPDSLARSAEAAFSPVSGLVWFIPACGLATWSMWIFLRGEQLGKRIGWALAVSLFVQLGLSILAGLTVHRDFFSLPFQIILIHYALFLDFGSHFRSRIFFQFAERFYSFTLGIIMFVLFWVAMMGWAVATRSEPRWVPSIVYNIVNIGLCCFLYLANLNLRYKSKRELLVSEDGIYLDGLNIVTLFTPAVVPLANWFFSQIRREGLTCREAQVLMGRPTCAERCTKISQCPGHRYAYNRLNELKRICAALRIGVVSAGPEGSEGGDEGWSFQPDSSIVIKNKSNWR